MSAPRAAAALAALLAASAAAQPGPDGRCPGGLWSESAQACLALGPPPDGGFVALASAPAAAGSEGQRRPGESGRDRIRFVGLAAGPASDEWDDGWPVGKDPGPADGERAEGPEVEGAGGAAAAREDVRGADGRDEWDEAWPVGKDPGGSESPYGEGRVSDVLEAPTKPGTGRVGPAVEPPRPLGRERVSVAGPPGGRAPGGALACAARLDGDLLAPRWQRSAAELNAYAIAERPTPSWLLLDRFRTVSDIPMRVSADFIAALDGSGIAGLDIGAGGAAGAAPHTVCDWMARLLERVGGRGRERGRWLELDVDRPAGVPGPQMLYPIMAPRGSLREAIGAIASDYRHSVGRWRFGHNELEAMDGDGNPRFDYEVRRSALHLSPPDLTAMLRDLGRLFGFHIRVNALDRTLDFQPAQGARLARPAAGGGR